MEGVPINENSSDNIFDRIDKLKEEFDENQRAIRELNMELNRKIDALQNRQEEIFNYMKDLLAPSGRN